MTSTQFHNFTEAISLALTVPAIILALAVVKIWLPRVFEARRRNEMGEVQWLILGVSISFIGASLDNAYWAIPWSLQFMGKPQAEFWFSFGSVPNIFFRQIAGIIAACCHMRSFYASRKGYKSLEFFLLVTHVMGIFFVLALISLS